MPIEAGLLGLAIGGAVATFFSPCVYALLPAYAGYVAHDLGPDPSTTTIVGRGLAGAAGAMGAFGILGVGAILAGDLLRVGFPALEVAVGLALVAFGIALLTGRYPHAAIRVPRPTGSPAGFVAFGAGYATAGAGCVAPVFFAVMLAAAAAPVGVGVSAVAAYAITFAVLLVAATFVAAAGTDLAVDQIAPLADRLTKVVGVVIILAGAVQVAIGLGWSPPVW